MYFSYTMCLRVFGHLYEQNRSLLNTTCLRSIQNGCCIMDISHCSKVKCYQLFFQRATATGAYKAFSTRVTQYSNEENESDTSFPVRRNVDSKGIPLSLLGDGINKNIHFFNRLKKRKPLQSKNSVSLPIAVSLRNKCMTSEMLSCYPNFPEVRTATESSKPAEIPVQYPFATNQSKLVNSEEHTVLLNKSQIKLQMPRKEVEDDLIAAKEELWRLNNGTPDASVPVSNIGCGGCGALLHCKDPSLPGYMPSEKFKHCSKQRLKDEMCQRCLYLQHFNIALAVSVSPEVYPKIISEIKAKDALVILIVDITDFPCSLWPGIINLIGEKKPVFVIANKVDLLPCDHKGYLHHIVLSLKESLKHFGVDRNGNIRHVSVISAKTGYGIEELITKIHKVWNKGDIYLIGCTNVGKSTLFNILLASDLCKVQAIDTVQHATISQWPGTTLNLLKFPILRMTRKRLYLRTKRLIGERQSKTEETKLRKVMYNETEESEYATLTGRVGKTFRSEEEKVVTKGKRFNPNANEFVHGHFCYDTPGTIYEDQIINLLTVEELMLTLPKEIITPRTYKIFKCQTLFVAGLIRVDLIDAPQSILLTLFSSDHLPVHMVYTEQSEKFYDHYLGTEMLAVPYGGPERLQDFPSLVPKEVEVVGSGWKESCADVSLSSVGWLSITLGKGELCKLSVYTPGGRGCYVRKPPLLPFAVKLKGKRIRGTQKYENSSVSIKR